MRGTHGDRPAMTPMTADPASRPRWPPTRVRDRRPRRRPTSIADPIAQWQRWYDEAVEAGCVEPNAFVLSTVDDDGFPQSRYLLARGADERGFSFFTNYESAKSQQLAADGRASLLFTWLQLHRQVRVTVMVERVPDDESDAYFASRPRSSQIGAWSSPQSQVLPDRDGLDQRVAEMTAHLRAGRAGAAPGVLGWLAGCGRRRSSSGRVGPAACTTACATAAPTTGWVDRAPRALIRVPISRFRRSRCRRRATRPSTSAWVCGVRPGPSQSQNSGVVPRTRGGSSICTPCRGGRFTGLRGCRPRSSFGIRVEVGRDLVGRQVRRAATRPRGRPARGSVRRAAAWCRSRAGRSRAR